MSGWLGDPAAWHPAVVHFPVALFLVAPLLVLPALRSPGPRARPLLGAALFLLLVASAAAALAVATGTAAAAVAELPAGGEELLARHRALGLGVPWAGLALAVGLAAQIGWHRAEWERGRRRLALGLWLAAALAVALLVAATADAGGRLVHDLGVTARPAAAR